VDLDTTIDLITALWLGTIGACVGSFLNVVAYRLPLGKSVIWQSSHCPRCNHAIRPYDNVPVLGWLWLRGRCRDCGQPISPRYAIVEAVNGAAFFALAYLELFNAGSFLPGGPFTERRGAAELVLHPHWPTLGLYFFNCLSFSGVVVCTLLWKDRNLSTARFLVLTLTLLAMWPLSAKLISVLA
jgi:leader peptidase (prepilin peptidase) / N-methyltransferase